MMDKKQVNDVLRQNVALLSKQSEKEVGMMPATEAPLPSVDQVKQIVTLAKRIIFPDYFNKRQPDEAIRAYYIGVYMEELATLHIQHVGWMRLMVSHCNSGIPLPTRDTPIPTSRQPRK